MNPRNVDSFSHGISWRTHSGDEEAKQTSTMTKHSVEVSMKFEEIVGQHLEVLPSTIHSIVGGMGSQLMQGLYSAVSESTERIGNVVSAGQFESPIEAFLAMIQKVKFGVNEAGEVSLPDIHVGPENPLKQLIESAGPEFQSRLNNVISQKSAEAFEEERQRLSRFKS